ncbi:MAG TPA: Crp/Fnr family transcriptional regulator [Cyclobacteriaceae bacterium]|nr:Crp/Fnr family transcriptional regulator [Cyclobacteriaceae bacterium]
MSAEDINDLLGKFFPSFDQDLKEIISKKGVLKTFSTGEQIMRPGQYFQSVMLVVRGRIKLYREGDDGNEFFIYLLEPGNACALSMVCAAKNEKSQMLATAIEETEVIMIPVSLMDELMKNHRSWYYFVLETYRNRFEELLQVVDSIAFKSMDERLEFYLQNLAQKFNQNELNITHQQIADDLNSSREVISRLLKKMEKEKKLKLNRNSIELLESKSFTSVH